MHPRHVAGVFLVLSLLGGLFSLLGMLPHVPFHEASNAPSNEEITTDVFFGLYQYEVCNSVNSTSSCSVHSYDKRSDNAANEHCFYSGYTAALLLLLGIASNLLAAFLLYNRTGSSCASLFGCFCWVLAGVVWYLACWLRASDFVVLQDSPEVEDRVGMAVYLLAVGIVFGLFAGLTGLCMPQRSRFHTPW